MTVVKYCLDRWFDLRARAHPDNQEPERGLQILFQGRRCWKMGFGGTVMGAARGQGASDDFPVI